MITDQELLHWFGPHINTVDHETAKVKIRTAALALAFRIRDNTPPGDTQAIALWRLRETVAAAHIAIAYGGQ